MLGTIVMQGVEQRHAESTWPGTGPARLSYPLGKEQRRPGPQRLGREEP
jgi:hypothetical protein